MMKHLLAAAAVVATMFIPASLVAQSQAQNRSWDHGEVQAYGDLFRVTPTKGSTTNFLGLGGLASFNTSAHVALEAQMTYDFEQNYTSISTNGATGGASSTTVTAKVRPITGLFGPKFQLGSHGPVRAFLEGKVGFLELATSCSGAAGSTSCFTSGLSNFGGASTHFAAFPGGGLEAFWGPIGFRVDAGDQMYWNNGTYNNLRVTFGPTLRF